MCSTAAIGLPVASMTMSTSGFGDQLLPVVRDRSRMRGRIQPTRFRFVFAFAGDRSAIADQLDARRLRHLREVHRGELARPDQADAKRVVRFRAQEASCVEVQRTVSFQGSATS